jgi:hypothetical protein
MTFEEISEPYIRQFGEPDQTLDLPLNKELYKQMYWYKHDVIAEFVAPQSNTKDGWELSFALSMAPMKYHRNIP